MEPLLKGKAQYCITPCTKYFRSKGSCCGLVVKREKINENDKYILGSLPSLGKLQ
jgi:hypothetical protein